MIIGKTKKLKEESTTVIVESMVRDGLTNRSIPFSHRALDAIAPLPEDWPSSNIEWTDTKESGLKAAKYKSGKISFRHRFVYRGKKMMMTLGEYPAVNLDKARERVRANKAMLAEDINPLDARQKTRDAVTFAEFVEQDYLPFAKKERKSFKDINNRLANRLIPEFGNIQLPQMNKRMINAFHVRLKDEISPTTANRCLALVSAIMKMAVDLELILANPARGISKFKEPSSRKRVLSDAELKRFVDALKEELDSPSGKALFLLLSTGLRKSEVLSLTWRNVYLEKGATKSRLFLPDTKNKIPRDVPLNSLATKLLEKMKAERQNDSDWVFPSNSEKGHQLDARRTFTTVLEKAGIQGLRMHDLRRSFASILINHGVSLYEVRDLLGHADVRTTQVYAQLQTVTLQNASEKAATHIEQAFAVSL